MVAKVSWFCRLPCRRMDSSSLTYCLVESNSLGLMRPMIHFSSFVLLTTCNQAGCSDAKEAIRMRGLGGHSPLRTTRQQT